MPNPQETPPSLALIALGSNLGDPVATVSAAMERLERFSTRPLLKSSLWETTPVDCPPGSPRFINAAVALTPHPEETPESLLEKLQSLEREFGRRPKTVLNEPRPLDLDLIAFGTEVRTGAALTLPHPRAHLRRFVLQPLAEIVPDLLLDRRSTVTELLQRLPADEALRRVVVR